MDFGIESAMVDLPLYGFAAKDFLKLDASGAKSDAWHGAWDPSLADCGIKGVPYPQGIFGYTLAQCSSTPPLELGGSGRGFTTAPLGGGSPLKYHSSFSPP